jgi:hypothetical protein
MEVIIAQRRQNSAVLTYSENGAMFPNNGMGSPRKSPSLKGKLHRRPRRRSFEQEITESSETMDLGERRTKWFVFSEEYEG